MSSPQQGTTGAGPPAAAWRLAAASIPSPLLLIAAALSIAACRGPGPVSPGDSEGETQADSELTSDEAAAGTQQGEGAATAGPPATGEFQAPLIEFQPVGLTPLYQGFLTDLGAIAVLRSGLAGRLNARVVVLKVVWDQRSMSATITLHMPERDERFEPLSEAVVRNQPVPAQEVQPLLAALGAYRAYLGARFDLRILSFDIRLSWWDPDSGSHCTISGIVNDPEGRELAPCFECVHVGDEELKLCRTGEQWPAPLSGSESGRKMLGSALRSSL